MDEIDLGSVPAYPGWGSDEDGTSWYEAGLTLRQHYAGLALAGLLGRHCSPIDPREVAGIAVAAADALLAELARGRPPVRWTAAEVLEREA